MKIIIVCVLIGVAAVAASGGALEESAQFGGCNFLACVHSCRSTGFGTGDCIGDECICSGTLNRPHAAPTLGKAQEKSADASCYDKDFSECTRYCQDQGKSAGSCVTHGARFAQVRCICHS